MRLVLRLLSAALTTVATLAIASGAVLWAAAALLNSVSSNND